MLAKRQKVLYSVCAHEVTLDTYEEPLLLIFNFNTFVLLLVLGLPPLTIWFGKIAGGLTGWRLASFPVIFYTCGVCITATAATASLLLTDAWGWSDPAAESIRDAILLIGTACFVYGFMVPDDARSTWNRRNA